LVHADYSSHDVCRSFSQSFQKLATEADHHIGFFTYSRKGYHYGAD